MVTRQAVCYSKCESGPPDSQMLMIEGFAEPYGVLSQLCCAVPKPPNDVDLKLAYLRALFEKIWNLVIAFGHAHA